MGLKQNIINAKVAGLMVNGIEEKNIDISRGSAIEVESELIKEAIVNFLTKVDFTITQLNANVVLEYGYWKRCGWFKFNWLCLYR